MSPAIFGVALIVLMYVLPEGVVGGVRRLFAWTTSGLSVLADVVAQPRPFRREKEVIMVQLVISSRRTARPRSAAGAVPCSWRSHS